MKPDKQIRHVAQPPRVLNDERGIALIVVMLLLMVLSGLATGFAVSGQVEGQMGQNEVYFAGARAAAEAGLNRAIVTITTDTTTNWLAGQDGTVDSANPTASVNSDNGSLAFKLGTGPYYVDANHDYYYEVSILDDDNDELYENPSGDYTAAPMSENNDPYVNTNDRLILRAIGYGPHGTVVKLARMLESVDTTNVTTTTTTTLSNPAILVNGNLEMNGAITVTGTTGHMGSGSVHANGNLSKTGTSGTVTGDATASGTYSTAGGFTPGGSSGGGRPTVTVPDIHASTYQAVADYKLAYVGGVLQIYTHDSTLVGWNTTPCSSGPCNTAKGSWSYSGGYFNASSNPTSATYYVEGSVDIGSTSGSSNKSVSVLATGDIRVHGNAKLQPENTELIQFVADGDLTIDNGSDLDPPVNVDGQIMVRGQFDAGGNMEFQGRVMVGDVSGAGTLVANGANKIHGSVTFTYGGTLAGISSTTTTTTSTTTYVNNVSGWIEQ